MKKLRDADLIRQQAAENAIKMAKNMKQDPLARVGRQQLKLVPNKPEPGDIWTWLAGAVIGGLVLGALGFVLALLKAGGLW